MLFPTYIVDNFFDNPHEIVEYAKTLEYIPADDGRWPGARTKQLHEFNNELFEMVTRKVTKIIWPYHAPHHIWRGSTTFQKIPADAKTGAGWIHSDTPSELTALIYLSHHKNCGTSIYKPKDGRFANDSIHVDLKCDYYKNDKEKDTAYYKALKENNDLFEKTTQVNSVFNRCLLFDSHALHGADYFYDPNCKEDRLTMITFFAAFGGGLKGMKFPIPEMKRA